MAHGATLSIRDRSPPRIDETTEVHEGGVEVGQVVKGRRAEDQIEPVWIGEGREVSDLVADACVRPTPGGDVDQRLTHIETQDVVEVVGQRKGMASRAASRVKCPPAAARQVPKQPLEHHGRLQGCESVVVRSDAVE